jgi:two-component system, OmpR family, KDP operon response regulator KdpE
MSAAAARAPQKTEVQKILVVEDEVRMLRVLQLALSEHGYKVLEATTGQRALGLTAERKPSLVLLDLGLPDMDGVEVAAQIREISRVPIVVLSARSNESDIVQALDRGANDYVVKPFREAELFARIRASLRGFARIEEGDQDLGDIHIETSRRRVSIRGREVKLSGTEFRLLCVLVRSGGTVVTHQQLLRDVWGPAYLDEVRYLRVYMHHLRDKLEPDPGQPQYLLTEPGIGYRLQPSGDR